MSSDDGAKSNESDQGKVKQLNPDDDFETDNVSVARNCDYFKTFLCNLELRGKSGLTAESLNKVEKLKKDMQMFIDGNSESGQGKFDEHPLSVKPKLPKNSHEDNKEGKFDLKNEKAESVGSKKKRGSNKFKMEDESEFSSVNFEYEGSSEEEDRRYRGTGRRGVFAVHV